MKKAKTNKTNQNINKSDVYEDNNIVQINNNEIDIKQLLNELEYIGNENEKNEFIKNYNRIKEQIKAVDSILFNQSNFIDNNIKNDNINELESNNISELLNILESNENKIFNSDNLNVIELKSLMNICNILEKKINQETIDIIEIK